MDMAGTALGLDARSNLAQTFDESVPEIGARELAMADSTSQAEQGPRALPFSNLTSSDVFLTLDDFCNERREGSRPFQNVLMCSFERSSR